MKKVRPRLTFANVTSCLALFVALGGFAVAAGLPKNSVGPKQLKKNSVTTAKVKKEAITAAKVKKGTLTGTQINASTLGTVPVAQTANSATVASSLPPAEPWHEVGAPGEPHFLGGWENTGLGNVPAGYYKDQLGTVHLRGSVKAPEASEGSIFALPPGFRPISESDSLFIAYCAGGTICDLLGGRVDILGNNYDAEHPEMSGLVLSSPTNQLSLDGITFRAES
jgi:hypothetical protein